MNILRFSLAFVLLPITAFAATNEAADLQALRAQVRALEQQLKELAHQIDLKEQAAANAHPAATTTSVSDSGFGLTSSDGANAIHLRGLLQLDSRLFFDDGGIVNNTFTLRR